MFLYCLILFRTAQTLNLSKCLFFQSWTPGVCVRDFPKELKEDLPFYIGGFDFHGRPGNPPAILMLFQFIDLHCLKQLPDLLGLCIVVVVAEIGHWHLRKWLEDSETDRELTYRYAEHVWCTLHNYTSPKPNAAGGFVLIHDMADFPASELESPEGKFD